MGLDHIPNSITSTPLIIKLKSILARIALAFIVVLCVGGLCLWSGNVLIVTDNHPQKSDVIIVLGFPAQDDGTPSLTMKARVEKAVDLYRDGYASAIMLAGGAVRNEFTEAEVMARYAEKLGVPESSLVLEPNSRDTIQNARYTIELMREHGWTSAIVVTSPYHTRRAYGVFSKHIEVSVIAAKHPPELSWYHRLGEIAHEYIVFFWYEVRSEDVR